jgi:hypothetical protein
LLAADVVPWKTIGMLMMGMSEEEAAKFNDDRTIGERRMTQAIAERRERIRDEASLTLRETSKRLGMTESTARAHKLRRQAQVKAMDEADRGLATNELGRRIEGALRRRFAPAAAARACAGDDHRECRPAGRRRSKRGRGEGDQSPKGAGKRTRANPGVG